MNKNTTTIEIDLDVYKALHNQIIQFEEPLNNVLRRILKIDKSSGSSIPESLKQNQNALAIVKRGRGIVATGILDNNGNGIKVLKGSTFSKTAAPRFKGSYADQRNEMIQKGKLNKNFELVEDYYFTSLSAAASVVLGSQNNAGPWQK